MIPMVYKVRFTKLLMELNMIPINIYVAILVIHQTSIILRSTEMLKYRFSCYTREFLYGEDLILFFCFVFLPKSPLAATTAAGRGGWEGGDKQNNINIYFFFFKTEKL